VRARGPANTGDPANPLRARRVLFRIVSLTHLRLRRGRPAARGLRPVLLRLAPRAVVVGLLFTGVTGCRSSAWTRLGMPRPITEQGKAMVTLWQGSWVAALAVGLVVWGLIVWAVIFHRKRSDELPPQVRYNLPIEVLYTIVPFIMVAVLFYFTARDENYINELPPRPDVIVHVTGFQWSWQFQYPQYGVRVIGHPVDPSHFASYPGPQLVLPKGETIRFDLYALDVVHAFWVPAFLFKRDVIPNRPNHFQVTTTATGTFDGRCSELCGLYHSEMLFTVKVVSPAQFQQWIAARQAAQRAAAQPAAQNAAGGAQ